VEEDGVGSSAERRETGTIQSDSRREGARREGGREEDGIELELELGIEEGRAEEEEDGAEASFGLGVGGE